MASEQKAAVEAASDRFYDALEQLLTGEAEPMRSIWSHRDDVTTMHPAGGREVGWSEVQDRWMAFADLVEDGSVTKGDQLVRIDGDLAYELLTERASFTLAGHPLDVTHRATNVYRLEADEWKIVHHHTDLSDEFVAILEGLETEV